MTGQATDVLKDTLRQDATKWLRWLEENIPKDSDGGGCARRERARQVLADYADGKTAIPVRTNDYSEAKGWEHRRDAVLLAMMLKYLNTLAHRWGEEASLTQLQQALGADPSPFQRGLSPDGKASDGLPQERAKGFLPDGLSTLLRHLGITAPSHWDPRDPAWASAWTLATTTVLIDWIVNKGGGTIATAARWLWTANLPTLRGRGGFKRPALPTDDKKLRVRLVGSPLVCAVVNDHKNGPTPSALDRALAETTVVMGDLNHYQEGDKTYYAGRKVLHLYLAAWNERVAQFLNAQESEPTMAELPSIPPSGSGLPAGVAPGQALTVGFLQDSFAGRVSPEGTWRAEPGSAAGNAMARYLRYPDVYQFKPEIRAAMAGDCAATIGTVNIPLGLIQEIGDAEWFDVEVIVRWRGEWRCLPLDIDDVADAPCDQGGAVSIQGDDATAAGVALRLSLDEERSADSFDIEALRAGFAQSKWVFRPAGLGLFIAGAIDLDSGGATA